MAYKVMLSGGGTGGHIYPLVAIAEQLQDQQKIHGLPTDILFIGNGELMKSEANRMGVSFSKIWVTKWRRYFSLLNFFGLFILPFSFLQSLIKVWAYMPDVILAKGGYASFMPAFVGWIMHIPIYVHESDSVPGKVNRWLGKHATAIFTSFDYTSQFFDATKVILTGHPIRKDVAMIYDKENALRAFNLDDSKPTVFITGGSQGAQRINDTIMVSLISLIQKYHVIHSCGDANFEEMNQRVLRIIEENKNEFGEMIKNNYHLYPTLTAEQMGLAYSACDVVISRAGSAIHEIAVLGKPAILVPLPESAQNHQFYNAKEMTNYGAIMVTQDNFKEHILMYELETAYQNRFDIASKILGFAKQDAAKKIADVLVGLT